ncbi:MAG: Glycosyltransferase [uncultured Caballeronia sp.]|nr:MAG: Glycosyltransferase [uncultured Caballeronia sp.]
MSLCVSVVYMILKFLYWNSFVMGVMGSAPLLIGLFFFSSVQLFFIGLLGEYVGAILTYAQKWPLVVERERIVGGGATTVVYSAATDTDSVSPTAQHQPHNYKKSDYFVTDILAKPFVETRLEDTRLALKWGVPIALIVVSMITGWWLTGGPSLDLNVPH